MEDFEFTYDVAKSLFVEEKSGYVLSAEYLMIAEDADVIERIRENTGVEISEFFLEIMRDTVEASVPTFPFGN